MNVLIDLPWIKPPLTSNRTRGNPEHLEAVTQAENNRRAAAVRYPGIRGVFKTNQSAINPWRAEIVIHGKTVYLGLFATREEAEQARLNAERREQIKAEVDALKDGAK